MSALQVTIFSDFTSPACHVTEAALRGLSAAGRVEVRARAYERFPAPARPAAPAEDEDWEGPIRSLSGRLSLPLRVPDFRPRTRKAHEAAVFAAERQVGPRMREAIFRGYWAEGRDIGRIDVLAELAAGVGIEAEELRIALDIDLHRDAVLRDQEVARRLRITRVPTLFLGTGPRARILVGPRSREELEAAITSYGS